MGSSYSHHVPPGSNAASPNLSVAAALGGIGLRFHLAPWSIRASASSGPGSMSGGASVMGLGRSPSMGECEGLTTSYSHFPSTSNPANSTNGNGSGDVCRPPRRPTPVGPKKDD